MNYHVNDVLLRADLARIVARFHTKYERRGPDECWPWTGARRRSFGYGVFDVYDARKPRSVSAHRMAWALSFGPIADGVCVLHECDNPACVNVAHLFLGTMADNNEDKRLKGRQTKGAAIARSKLTETQVSAIRDDARPGPEIAAAYGIDPSVVYRIKRGKAWAHVDGPVRGSKARGSAHCNAILDEDKVRRIRQSGESPDLLAELFGVRRGTIDDVRSGRRWAHVR